MRATHAAVLVALAVITGGCAHIDFGDAGLVYYDPQPYLLVSVKADCTVATSVLVVPGRQRSLRFVGGYGSAELTAKLENGMIASVGQVTDTQVPETLGALADLGASVARIGAGALPSALPGGDCEPGATLLPIVNGRIDPANQVRLESSRKR